MDPTQLYNLMRDQGLSPADQAILAATGAPEGQTYGDGPAVAPEPSGPQGLFNDFVEPQYQTPRPTTTKTKEGSSTATSVSVREGGFSPEKFGQVQQAGTPLDKRLARDKQQVESEYAPFQARSAQTEQMEKEAVDKELEVVNQRLDIQAEGKRYVADIQQQYNLREQAAWATAKAESEKSFADYKAAQQEFAATSINPNAMFEEAGGFNRFGMGIAAFAHDFLGAKGIKTSAMDTLNGAIKRNIDAQIANMNHKGQVAAGFKEIWDMQRAMSSSDQEARQRMMGFALKAAEMSTDAYLSQYDSKLAGAKNLAAKALIQRKAIDEDVKLKSMIDAKYNNMAQLEVTRHGQELAAATSNYATSVSRKNAEDRLAWEKEQANRPKPADPSKDPMNKVLFDPETNKGKWLLKPGLSDAAENKVRDAIGDFEPLNKDLTRLRALSRKMGTAIDGVTGTRFSPEDQREYEAIRQSIAHSMIKAFGEKATDKDVEQMLKQMPYDTKLTNGGVESILAGTQRRANQALRGKMRQYVIDVPEGQQPDGPKVEVAEGSYTDAVGTNEGTNKVVPEHESRDPVVKTKYVLHHSDAFKGVSDGSSVFAVNPDLSVTSGQTGGMQATYDGFKKSGLNTTKAGGKVDNAFIQLYQLSTAASVYGDDKSKKLLADLADDSPDPALTRKENDLIRNYTLYLLTTDDRLRGISNIADTAKDAETLQTNPARYLNERRIPAQY